MENVLLKRKQEPREFQRLLFVGRVLFAEEVAKVRLEVFAGLEDEAVVDVLRSEQLVLEVLGLASVQLGLIEHHFFGP